MKQASHLQIIFTTVITINNGLSEVVVVVLIIYPNLVKHQVIVEAEAEAETILHQRNLIRQVADMSV